MVFFEQPLIDHWINEDAPLVDLTSELAGIDATPARITFRARHATRVSGTEEAAQIIQRLGGEVIDLRASGEDAEQGELLLAAHGPARALHRAWKVSLNLLEYACGIATRGRDMLAEARRANPEIMLFTTRKHPPGVKKVVTKAIRAGGLWPHRLGLSETVLAFDQHLNFVGGLEGFLERVRANRAAVAEKKVLVEVEDLDQALMAARAGVDGIQFDKLPVDELTENVQRLRRDHSGLTLLAAGGIREDNVADYAATGVDGLVLSSVYYVPPADIGVTLEPR